MGSVVQQRRAKRARKEMMERIGQVPDKEEQRKVVHHDHDVAVADGDV